MTHVTCRLTAKNRDQLRNPTLGNRVWATAVPIPVITTEISQKIFPITAVFPLITTVISHLRCSSQSQTVTGRAVHVTVPEMAKLCAPSH